MKSILHACILCLLLASSTVFHTVRESNAICGSNSLAFAPLPNGPFGEWQPYVLYWVYLTSPPVHGNLSITAATPTSFVVTTDPTIIYTPYPDFHGVDTFALTVARINYGYDWTLNNYAVVVRHHVTVLPAPSLPVINTTALTVFDPDGPGIKQQYSLAVDGCDTVVIDATSTEFRTKIIESVCTNVSMSSIVSVRGFVYFGPKPSFSVCPEYSVKAAQNSVYIDIPVSDWVIPPEIQVVSDIVPGGVSNYTLIQDQRVDSGFVQLSQDRELSFVAKDTTSFSASSLVDCIPLQYSLVNISMQTGDDLFFMSDVVWQICLVDKQSIPRVFPVTVRHVWASVPVRFHVIVADFNDGIRGTDDNQLSQFAYRGSPYSGVVFAQTNFSTSAIYADDCVTAVLPDIIYSNTKFCYIASLDAPEETTFVVAVDGAEDVSEPAMVRFEASIVIRVCDASSSGMPFITNQCTARGLESNSRYGEKSIPINFETYVFPESERNAQLSELVITFSVLPRYGKLYGARGEAISTQGRYSMASPLVYIGNADYFNFAVLSAVLGNGNAEDVEMFVDMKGVPFLQCQNVSSGCPDSFVFSYEHRTQTGVVGNGRFDIYVQAVGSEPVFYKNYEPPVTRDDPYQPANRYDSNIPTRVGKPYYHPRLKRTIVNDIYYHDPDGDLWEVELMVTAIGAYIGDVKVATENFNLALLAVEMDCKVEADNSTRYCGGTFILRGLPSDIKGFISQQLWFYNWPATTDDSADELVYFALSKRYTRQARNPLVYLVNGNRPNLQKLEDALSSCIDKKLTAINATSLIVPDGTAIAPRLVYRTLFPTRTSLPLISAAVVGVQGFFGDIPLDVSNLEIAEPDLDTGSNCWLLHAQLTRVANELTQKASSFGANPDYVCAAFYDSLGPSSVDTSFTDDVHDNTISSQYIAGPFVVEYLFKWKGWRNAPYQPFVPLPPVVPPTDFWVMLGDAMFAGAISNPSPENIALALIGIFLLFLPMPPIGLLLGSGLRNVAKLGPAMRSPAMAGVKGALTNAAAKGAVRKTTTRARIMRQDQVFQFVVSAGKNFVTAAKTTARLASQRAKALISAAKNRIQNTVRPPSFFNQIVSRLGKKLSRPTSNNLRVPRVPPRPPRPSRPVNSNRNFFDRELELPSSAIQKPGLFVKVINRVPTLKGRSLKLSAKYAKDAIKRVAQRVKEQIKGRISKALKKKPKAKGKGRVKKGRTRKRRQRRKEKTKRKKDIKGKMVKARGKGIPRPRPKKAKPKSKFLPFVFALRLISAVLSWLAYAAYLVMFVTYHTSGWVWERVFEEDEEEEEEEDEDSDDDDNSVSSTDDILV